MKTQSQQWFREIETIREEPWSAEQPPAAPVVPSITAPLHPELRRLFENIGVRKTLEPGERLFTGDSSVNSLALVTRGITARELGLGYGCNAIGIATPGRLACGNLNFYSSHACIGNYFAIVNAEVLIVPQETLRRVFAKLPDLGWLFSVNSELCALSDRLTFAAMTMLEAEDRVASFVIAWAANYGYRLRDEEGAEWISIPSLIQRRYLEKAVKASHTVLDRVLCGWKQRGLLRREGSRVWVRPEALASCYEWIRGLEEPSRFARPRTVAEAVAEPEADSDAAPEPPARRRPAVTFRRARPQNQCVMPA